MNKQIRNVILPVALFAIILLVLVACAPSTGGGSSGTETPGSPPNSLLFQIDYLYMTSTTTPTSTATPCSYPAMTSFGESQPIYIAWKERGDRQGQPLKIQIKNNGTLHIDVIPNVTPLNPNEDPRCGLYKLTLPLGRGFYQTILDPKSGIGPVEWEIK